MESELSILLFIGEISRSSVNTIYCCISKSVLFKGKVRVYIRQKIHVHALVIWSSCDSWLPTSAPTYLFRDEFYI